MTNFIYFIGFAAFAILGVACLITAVRLINGNRAEYERNRARTGSIANAFLGKAITTYDGPRDYRVAAGVAVDLARNEWIEQGRISDEALSSVFNNKN